jgi:hypothetical protein
MLMTMLVTGMATILLMLLAIYRIWRLSGGTNDPPTGGPSHRRTEEFAE